jgi:D-alanine-D-alanine ligase
MEKKINIAVIFYGNKNQLPVNFKQFEDLKEILTDFKLKKYDFNNGEYVKLCQDFRAGKIDIVLKNSYGRTNEADIESFLELNRIPYLGSSSRATLIGTSKLLAKQIFRLHGLPVIEDIFVDKIIWSDSKKIVLSKIKKLINYPCIIKDVGGTDSRGIYIARNEKECVNILSRAINKFQGMILEKYITGAYETTCMVVGNEKPEAYEPIGLKTEKGGFFSGEMKDSHSVSLEAPAKLPKKIIDRIKKVAEKAHQSLGCKTFSRADILVKGDNLYLLEVDVHPGFRKTSATFLSAKLNKESPNNLFLKFYSLTKQIYGKTKNL